MASVMEILIRAKDEASAILDRVGAVGEDSASKIAVNWDKAALAVVAAGVALEGLARTQSDTTFTLEKMAIRSGESTDAIRGWAEEISGANDTVSEMSQLMDLANRRGLEGKDALQNYAKFWDTIADASGESSTELAKAGVALGSVGIEAGNEKEAMAALGYILNDTSSSAEDFLGFVGKAGPSLRTMGMDVNDSAAVLGILQNEFGLTGRKAIGEFNTAVNSSDGDMNKLLATLGISSTMMGTYRGKVAANADILDKQAAAFDNSRTPVEHLGILLGNMTAQFGGVIGAASQAAPVLMAMGPIMWGVHAATSALSTAKMFLAGTALPAVSAAFAFLAANPIVLIIAAIAALVLGLIYLWNNCEEFREAVKAIFAVVSQVIGAQIDAVIAIFSGLVAAIKLHIDAAIAIFQFLFDTAKGIFDGLVTAIRLHIDAVIAIFRFLYDTAKGIFDGLSGAVTAVGKGVGDAFTAAGTIVKGAWDGISSAIKGNINFVIGLLNSFIGFVRGIKITVPSVDIPIVGRVGGFTVGMPWIPTIPTLETGAWDVVRRTLAYVDPGELVAPAPFASGLRAAMAVAGGGGVTNNYFNFPNYVGSRSELMAAITKELRLAGG